MCRDFSNREKTIGEPQTAEDLVTMGPRILDAFETAIADKVHKLKAPHEIAGQANRMAKLAKEQRTVLSGLVDAAKRSDFSKMSELSSRNATLNSESASVAKALGAADCAKSRSR
jgi:FixJ family two-component response regulator